MDIDKINRRHFTNTDMYYRVGHGISSKLIAFNKGIFVLEIIIAKKWGKDYNATAFEMANCWKKENKELAHAVGCKVFITDAKQHPYKNQLMHMGIKPLYDAKKGILFRKKFLN